MQTISVTQFKSHLSAELKKVSEGAAITVLDHGRPVARVVPVSENREMAYQKATKSFIDQDWSPLIKMDSLVALMADRESR